MKDQEKRLFIKTAIAEAVERIEAQITDINKMRVAMLISALQSEIATGEHLDALYEIAAKIRGTTATLAVSDIIRAASQTRLSPPPFGGELP